MEINFSKSLDLSSPTDLLVLPVIQDMVWVNPLVKLLDEALGGAVRQLAKSEDFKAKSSSSLSFNTMDKIGAQRVLLLGLGRAEEISGENFRRASGLAADALRKYHAGRTVFVCQAIEGRDLAIEQLVGAVVEGLKLGLYRFEKYKSG